MIEHHKMMAAATPTRRRGDSNVGDVAATDAAPAAANADTAAPPPSGWDGTGLDTKKRGKNYADNVVKGGDAVAGELNVRTYQIRELHAVADDVHVTAATDAFVLLDVPPELLIWSWHTDR